MILVLAVVPGGYCSPRHRMLFNSSNEGPTCVEWCGEQHLPDLTKWMVRASSIRGRGAARG